MSRHTFETEQYRVVVGWDSPLGTFFGQIWKDRENERPFIWIGSTAGDMVSVEELAANLEPYATIPPELCDILRRDQMEGRPPSYEQRKWVDRLQSFHQKRTGRPCHLLPKHRREVSERNNDKDLIACLPKKT